MMSSTLRYLSLGLALMFTGPAIAQQTVAEDDGAAAHVPASSLLSIRLNVETLVKTPAMEMVPIEVARAWCKETLGLDLDTVTEIKLVMGLPAGPGAPPVGAVVRVTKRFDPANIDVKLLSNPGIQEIAGQSVYVLGNPNDPLYLHVVDDQTVLVATRAMFEPMLSTPSGEGALAALIEANPMGDSIAQLIGSIEPARPLAMGIAQQFGQQLPPPLQGLTRVPEVLDALVIHGGFGTEASFEIEMLTSGEAQAAELREILTTAIDFANALAEAQIENEMAGQGAVAEAQRAYAKRMRDHFVQLLTPEQEGERLVIHGQAGISVATTGVLVGLLLPAVQAAREAARRTSAANDLKQIGLAFHNYHDVHKKFPDPAITDEQGKPLLSWRVAILPFVDQMELYKKFHLDEPWDSPHNIKLSQIVVPVYTDDSAPTLPAHTVYQAAVGEGLALNPEGDNRMRDMIDGTSNTILVFETAASEAVPWTAPIDAEINLDNPLAKMGRSHPGGFQVLLGDGSVRFISHAIDAGLFRALLTRSGGEALGAF